MMTRSKVDKSIVSQMDGLLELGKREGWHGFIGGSASRWLTSQDLMALQDKLEWERPELPLDVQVPALGLECFLISRQAGVRYDTGEDMWENSLSILQVSVGGDSYRILWENLPDDHAPLEVCIHLTVHNARPNGPGGVVYHCQPINLIALAGLAGQRETQLTDELQAGFAAIRNVIPDGVDCIPWGMTKPIARGMAMTRQMLQDMRTFMDAIGAHAANHEALVLEGEGLVVASRSELTVLGIVNTIEHSAEVRLKMLAAGGR